MKVSELITTTAEVLQDTEHIVYTEPQLVKAVNEACLATVLVKPESCSDVMTVTLVAGSRQALPPQALRLLDAYYRLDDAENPVAHIILTDREEFSFFPTPGSVVQHVAYSEKVPDVFWVDPPAEANVKLALVCSQAPATVTKDDDFPLTEKYAVPVTEYMLYLMFRRDSQRSPNTSRAQAHRQAFFDLLQVKTQADMTVSAETQRMSDM